MWRPEERGKAIAHCTPSRRVGLAIGPVAGVSERCDVHHQCPTLTFLFFLQLWAVTFVDALIQGLGLLYLKETFGPVFLERKMARLQREMGLSKEEGRRRVFTPFSSEVRSWCSIFTRVRTRS
jgi:hypothetical protein